MPMLECSLVWMRLFRGTNTAIADELSKLEAIRLQIS